MKLGTEYKIVFKASDFEANFHDSYDCPLNRAARRHFNWRYKVMVNFNTINLSREGSRYRSLKVKGFVVGSQHFVTGTFFEDDCKMLRKYKDVHPDEEVAILLEEQRPGGIYVRF